MENKVIEKKWQDIWEKNEYGKAINNSDKKKYYILVEFPYPSGSGLHVGHVRSYTALDSYARMKRMQGYNVLFPMGWDAFGAPAEQYAIKNHIHPKMAVKENIKTFKSQIKSLGISFDWSREFSTTDPEYYKWTQWQFLKFYEHGMAYKAKKDINWCPNCKTGLSNEDSSGGVCERCGTKVVQKEKEQWMLRMSDYAESLLEGLKDTHFANKVKLGQINWIGKSVGAEVIFKVLDTDKTIKVYTTRCDTLFGATFMVLAPEHPLIEELSDKITNMNEVEEYQKSAKEKTTFERTELQKDKTGVQLKGIYAVNPVNNEKVQIWISDYVMMGYGTGAIMAVPAHDERDYEFAKKFNIPIIQVLEEVTGKKHEDEKVKNSIVAIVHDKKNDKYLTINWHSFGGRLFVGGTKKENESSIDCAIREIKEETGYFDISLVYEGFKINHRYYAYNKDTYFNIEATPLLFELNSDKMVDRVLDSDEKFDVEWVSSDVLINEINDELHRKSFEYVTKPGAMVNDGIHINSDFLNGLNKDDAINKMLEFLEKENVGNKKVNYRLQDWVFSRQRFWGEPIPLVHCDDCGWVPVKEEDLPVLLPDVTEYEPTDDGESPLAKITDWVNTTCPKCGKPAKRETDTMPNWAGSSWYWLRFMDPKNDKCFASMDALKYWGKVDWYNGGMEHTTRHLLYARFWNQFLYNIGLVPNSEPMDIRVSHGMILGANNEKMSKSKGNVVNPDDIVNEYGADTLRTYEMFIGDYEKDAAWSIESLKGCKRFLDRVERLQNKLNDKSGYTDEVIINKTIKKVTYDLSNMKYNTVVSQLMILTGFYEKCESITKDDYRILLQLLNPIAPHITEELNERQNLGEMFANSKWPEYDESKTILDEVTIGVQVNGKLRGEIKIAKDEKKDSVIEKALKEENVMKHISGKEIVKTIVVPNKIVNIVIK